MAKTDISPVTTLFLVLLASQALAAGGTVSRVLGQLKTLRPGVPLSVAIKINIPGTSRRWSRGSRGLRFAGADLKVIGNTLTGSCSMISQKAARRGQTAVAVDSCFPFRNVRKVLLHQTQGSKAEAGMYEFANIRYCSGTTLRLQRPLRRTYSSSVIGGASPRVSQVVPVMQARNIDVCDGGLIQAPEWNGRCGGIIAVQASGNINICPNSKVSASGAGFRGAPQFVSRHDYVHGYVGESEAIGYGVRRQKNGVGSAGGSSIGNSGGYGGAHASFGSAPTAGGCGKGNSAGKPSVTLSSNGNGRSYFGGSGGASGSHGTSLFGRNGAKGGASGGMVVMIARGWIKTPSATSVQANGMAGQDGYTIPGAQQVMGGGGGGAGGSVLFKEGNRKFRFQASVSGGAGGIMVKFGGGCGNSGRGGTGGIGTVAVLA